MKKSVLFSFLVLLLISMTFTSCDKTDTDLSPTGNDRDKFLGAWSVHEIHTKADFVVTILEDPNETSRILIDNFANLITGNRATAVVSGSTITLDAEQTVGNMTVIGGSGTLTEPTKMSWTYSLTDGATRTDATATFTKK
jgi:hypothetical protein